MSVQSSEIDAYSSIAIELAAAQEALRLVDEELAATRVALEAAAADREAARALRLKLQKVEARRTACAKAERLAGAKVRKASVALQRQNELDEVLATCTDGFALAEDPDKAWAILSKSIPCRFLELAPPAKTPSPRHLRCVCISDTHGAHDSLVLPSGDVLLHAGDFTEAGEVEQIRSFCEWLEAQPFEHKIVVAGNHDITLDAPYYQRSGYLRYHKRRGIEPYDCEEARQLLQAACTYLENESCTIEGLSIYGSPVQPTFGDWAFGRPRGASIAEGWAQIPDHTDILLVHGPPLGFGDVTTRNERSGCVDLLREVHQRVKPNFVVFGHVHEGYGMSSDGQTTYVNAASCGRAQPDGVYNIANPPLVFDVALPSVP